METPLFFNNKDYKLFAILHEPNLAVLDSSQKEKTAIIVCYPFAEEHMMSHRVMVNMARDLSARGYYVFRFDFMGHGDSQGNFDESTITSRLSDIKSAIDFLNKHVCPNRIGLLGVRFGATLAALSVGMSDHIDFLILVAPIIKGREYIDECLRSNLATQLAIFGVVKKKRKQLVDDLMAGEMVNIDGYLISKEMYIEMSKINLVDVAVNMPKNVRVLIMQVMKDERTGVSYVLEELYSAYRKFKIPTTFKKVTDIFFWAESRIYKPKAKLITAEIIQWLPIQDDNS